MRQLWGAGLVDHTTGTRWIPLLRDVPAALEQGRKAQRGDPRRKGEAMKGESIAQLLSRWRVKCDALYEESRTAEPTTSAALINHAEAIRICIMDLKATVDQTKEKP